MRVRATKSRLRIILNELGWSQKMLSEKIKMHESNVSELVNDEHVASTEILALLSFVTGYPMHAFYEWEIVYDNGVVEPLIFKE